MLCEDIRGFQRFSLLEMLCRATYRGFESTISATVSQKTVALQRFSAHNERIYAPVEIYINDCGGCATPKSASVFGSEYVFTSLSL